MADEATPTTDTADESTAGSVNTEAAATEADPQGAEALGDPGKKALDAMKAARNEAREEAKRIQAEFEAFKAKAEGREAEFEATRRQAEAEAAALSKANERILKAEVRATAAGKLADPMDALRFIDLSEFEVGSDGQVDGDAVAAAIDDLVKTKPYLAAQGKRFEGNADGGARTESRPSQLRQSDLDRMSPEQIVAAKAEGRLDDLLGRHR